MSFEIGINTVIMLVGPSQSGKSTWAKHFYNKVLEKDPELRTTIISSDEIRRDLLCQNYDRYDPKMMEASEAAFELLFARLKSAIKFPINNEFVIIDTTGLDPDFRRSVSEIAKENGYRTAIVMFDYTTSDYFMGLNSREKMIVGKHVDTFKKRTLPGIKRKHFDYSLTVKSKDKKNFIDLQVNFIDYELWRKCNLSERNYNSQKPVAIIGDIHEHVYALDLLIKRLPENTQIIFVGDIVDKGNQTKEVIEYVEKLIDNGALIVVGNHEAFVARRLRGEIESIANENELFPSLKVFKEDAQLAARFLKMYDQMLPFACVKTHGKTIYVTHAPCYNKSLGKLDEKSRKFQRNFYFATRDSDSMIKELSFIQEQAKGSHPYHVFGHVPHAMKSLEIKNKIWLDTGAVYGGKLSAFIVFPDGANKIISQQAPQLTDGKLLFSHREKSKVEVAENGTVKQTIEIVEQIIPAKIALYNDDVKLEVSSKLSSKREVIDNNCFTELALKYKMSIEDKYWLTMFNESGAKFISGTMSPSRSTKIALEPVNSALEYYRSKNIEKIIIQPKYMGSRLQVYLHRDKSKDFAVTRSGTKSGHKKELQIIFDHWHAILDKKDFWKDSLILDGELLPWSAIGKDLIEKEFLQYGKSIEKELSLLETDVTYSQYQDEIKLNVESHTKEVKIFMEQLELYGKEDAVTYKPFTILSVDGKNWVNENQANIFTQLLPTEPYMIINLKDENAVENAEVFFQSLTESFENQGLGHEGIVIKPIIYKEGVAPYMKVRNEKYLHLIYGYDYKFNYEKMVANKKINKKLEMSIKEYEIGMKMLDSKSKYELLDLACQMKYQINAEVSLDPRL